MSTNYYLFSTDDEWVKKYFIDNNKMAMYRFTDDPHLSYTIHIGKRSGGWKPLFMSYPNAYMSVGQMIDFLEKHKDKYTIRDEYRNEMTLDELNKELIHWADGQTKRKFVWHKYGSDYKLDQTEEDKYDIMSPFSHIVYEIQYNLMHNMSKPSGWNFYKDDNGYEFSVNRFG